MVVRSALFVALLLTGASCAEEEKTEAEYVLGCEDVIDNDGDQLFDCMDPDCFRSPVCRFGEGGGANGNNSNTDHAAVSGACADLVTCCEELAGPSAAACRSSVEQAQALGTAEAESSCTDALDAIQLGGVCL